MRIGNVVQSLPSHSYAQGIPAIPQYQQNNLAQYSLQTIVPSPDPSYPYPASQSYSSYPQQVAFQAPPPTSAFPPAVIAKPGFSLYSYSQHFQQKPYFPTSPVYSPAPTPYPTQQGPVRSYYKFQGPMPLAQYSYQQFDTVDKNSGFPFQQLNAGETLPQQSSLVYGHVDPRQLPVYQTDRFARNPSQNATAYHWLQSLYISRLKISNPPPLARDLPPFIHAIPSV